jgi:ribokinase
VAAVAGRRLRLAVVGHVEWVTFARAPFIPASGEIVYAEDPWEQPAGGGAVSAAALARMGADVTFFTAIGSDRRAAPLLRALGVVLEAAPRDVAQTPVLTLHDPAGERTIIVVGDRLHATADDPLAWESLADHDGVYFTGSDPRTLGLARAAPLVVVTARRFEELVESGVRADALVGSGRDPGEQFDLSLLRERPRHVVVTEGADGGYVLDERGPRTRYAAAEPPGPVVDTYGAGDTFVAGFLFGLASGRSLEDALEFAAARAAEALTWPGAYPDWPPPAAR